MKKWESLRFVNRDTPFFVKGCVQTAMNEVQLFTRLLGVDLGKRKPRTGHMGQVGKRTRSVNISTRLIIR